MNAAPSGLISTGETSHTCMKNAYHGCPWPLPQSEDDIAKTRKKEGWRFLG